MGLSGYAREDGAWCSVKLSGWNGVTSFQTTATATATTLHSTPVLAVDHSQPSLINLVSHRRLTRTLGREEICPSGTSSALDCACYAADRMC
jgi:hypothetical protein